MASILLNIASIAFRLIDQLLDFRIKKPHQPVVHFPTTLIKKTHQRVPLATNATQGRFGVFLVALPLLLQLPAR